ncbi:hypothetical protein LEMLEM_LOCUS23725, partial [Lemmus lemmus]
ENRRSWERAPAKHFRLSLEPNTPGHSRVRKFCHVLLPYHRRRCRRPAEQELKTAKVKLSSVEVDLH